MNVTISGVIEKDEAIKDKVLDAIIVPDVDEAVCML